MGKCECHGATEAPCWCENCCQQMSDDACAKETARADAAEAKLTEERKAHEELREAVDSLGRDGKGFILYHSDHLQLFSVVPLDNDGPNPHHTAESDWHPTAADAILAWARSVKK